MLQKFELKVERTANIFAGWYLYFHTVTFTVIMCLPINCQNMRTDSADVSLFSHCFVSLVAGSRHHQPIVFHGAFAYGLM